MITTQSANASSLTRLTSRAGTRAGPRTADQPTPRGDRAEPVAHLDAVDESERGVECAPETPVAGVTPHGDEQDALRLQSRAHSVEKRGGVGRLVEHLVEHDDIEATEIEGGEVPHDEPGSSMGSCGRGMDRGVA